MDVRLFEGATSFYALDGGGAGTGYTFSRNFLSWRIGVPPLAELRQHTQMVNRARSRRLLNVIKRNHALDLHYSLPLRTLFRIEKRVPDLHALRMLAVFPDIMSATGATGEPRLLAYECTPPEQDGKLVFLYLPAVMKYYRPARESEYRALKALLEASRFPELKALHFVHAPRTLESEAV